MPDWFAANAPKQDDWFSANAPNPSPSLSSDSEETRGEMRGSARKREDSGSDWFDANQPPKIKPYRMPVKDDMGSAAVGAISSAINAAGPGRSASGAATFQPVNPNPKVEYAPHLKAQQGKTWNAPTAPPMVLPEPDIQPLVPAKLAAEEFINPSKPVVAAGHGGTVSSAQPIKATPSDENIGQVLAGAATGTGKFVEGLITPENVAIGAMMMLPGVAPAATTYFTFDMMKSAVEQAPEVLAKWKAGDKKGAVEAAVQVAGSAYFAKKGTEHLAKQARPAIERLTQKMEPLVTKPPALTTPMADRYPNQEFIPGDKGADAAPPKPKSAQGSFATFMRDQKRETVVPEEGIPESQARAQAAREDAALETTGPVPPMAEPPAPPWAPPAPEQRSTVAPRPMPPPLGMPPAAEYRALRQSAQRGVENIDAVRALRDEAMRKPVETNPFVMKPAAESAEVFKNQPIPGEGSAAESAQAFQSQIQPTGRPVPGRPPELKTPVDPMAAKNEMARAVAGKDYKSLTPDERVLVDRGLAEVKGRKAEKPQAQPQVSQKAAVAPPELASPVRETSPAEAQSYSDAMYNFAESIRQGKGLDEVGLSKFSAADQVSLRQLAHEYRPRPTPAPEAVKTIRQGAGGVEEVNSKFSNIDGADEYVYHVTTKQNAAKILNGGFRHGQPQSMAQGFYADYSKGKVFFADKGGVRYWQEKIQNHLEHQYDNPPKTTVLRIKKSDLPKLQSDEVGKRDSGAGSYYLEPAATLATKSTPPTLSSPGFKEPWEMTRAQAGVSEQPVIPDAPRPLTKTYGPNYKARPDIANIEAEFRKATTARSKALKAHKDYVQRSNEHLGAVKAAISEGKPVPAEVIADYPYLQEKQSSILERLDATGKAAQERIRAKGSTTSMNDFLNPETIRDYAQSIAGDIARGALTVERFVADMVAKHGPAVKEHAQRIWAEAQRFANDIGGEDTVTMPAVKKVVDKFKKDERPIEEQYLNFDRIRVSPAEEAALRSEYQAQSANGTLLPKETIPMVDIHGAAAGVTPGQIKAKSAQSMDYVGNNAVTMAARQRQLALGREFSQTVAEYERTKSGMSTEQREAAEARIDEYRGNLHAYNNVLEPLRKQAGLGLRVWRDLADSTWDASFWMRQAKDAKGIPSDRTLPKSVENQIGKLVGEGQAAQQAVDQGLRESGYSVEMEAKLKAAQEKAKQFIDKNQGNPALQAQLAEAQKQFRNAREQYQRMLVKREQMLTNLPQLKQHAVNLKNAKVRIAKEMAAMEKDGFLELTSAAIKAIPLLGLKTHERNIAGTVLNTHIAEPLKSLPVAIVDATRTAFGYQKGRETTAVTPRMYWNALEHQFSKTGGRGEAVEVFKHGARKQDIASGDWQRELNFQKDWIPESVSRNINAFVNTTFRVLSAEDRFNKSFAIQLALERQAKAHAINEARQWLIRKTEIKTRMTELVSSPTPEMEMNAILYGDMATYNNKNKMAQGVNQIRASLNPVVRTFGFDPIIRYIRTPMNVAMTAIQLNPVVGPAISIGKAVALKHQVGKARKSLRADIKEGLEPEGIALREKDIADFKAKLTPEVNRAYAEALGRGAVGSAITLLGWYLADQGLLTGYDAGATPADRGRMDVTDRPAASIFIGGKWRKISAFAPVVSPLLMAATLYQMWKEDSRKVKANPGSAVSKAVWSTAAGWMDLPMNTGIKTVSDAFKSPESLDKKAISYVKATVGSLIPPIATELDKAMTPNKKATVGAEFQSRVPGARGKLPDGLDAFGRTTPESKWVMVDAFDSTAPKTDHLSNEMDRLKVGVTKLNRGTIFTLTTANGERMEFETQREMQDVADEYAHAGEQVKAGAYEEPEDRLRARQQIVGTLMRELGHVAVTDPDYAGMTDNEKRKQIEQAFRESRGEMSKIMRDPRFGAMSKPEQIKILSDLVKDLSQ